MPIFIHFSVSEEKQADTEKLRFSYKENLKEKAECRLKAIHFFFFSFLSTNICLRCVKSIVNLVTSD